MHTRISKATIESRLVPHCDKFHKQSLLRFSNMEFMFKGLQQCHIISQNSLAYILLHDFCVFYYYSILLVLYYNH